MQGKIYVFNPSQIDEEVHTKRRQQTPHHSFRRTKIHSQAHQTSHIASRVQIKQRNCQL